MDEKGVPGSFLYICKKKSESYHPMCFHISCAFFALGLLLRPHEVNERMSQVFGKMIQGSAQLLGLLVWKVHSANAENTELHQKLETARRDIDELKRIRSEDAKANEKVMSIFNTQEQCWLSERRILQQHIGHLTNEIKFLENKKDQEIAGFGEKLKEMEELVQSKDKVLADEEQKRNELEEKIEKAENAAKELRVIAKHEAEEHSSEIWKHKTAFVELVSNQRQLEAEMGRALRQVENTKQELSTVLEKKEECVLLVQKLSVELVKTRKDLERKENILSAMMKESRLEAAEKKRLIKELQSSRTKTTEAEFETDKWKSICESKYERQSVKNILAGKVRSRRDIVSNAQRLNSNLSRLSHIAMTKSYRDNRKTEHEHPIMRNIIDVSPPFSAPCSGEGTDIKCMDGSVHSESEKYTASIEQRHHIELDAFAEQMWFKNEKLEALHQQFLHMDLEAKQMKSHAEDMRQDISQLRNENMRLEELLQEREKELNILKERLASQSKIVSSQMTDLKSSQPYPTLPHDNIWSKVKTIRKKIREKEKEKTVQFNTSEEKTRKKNAKKIITERPENAVQAPQKFPAEGGPHPKLNENEANSDDMSASSSQPLAKESDDRSKMDLHALGVSYKIKRLKQQLIFVESLIGKQESSNPTEDHDGGANDKERLYSLISLLNRQVERYQSLQGKADNLCKRMQESKLEASHRNSSVPRSKRETQSLEQFLEETFQLQRYIVATGQKLMEVHSKISLEYVGITEEHDMVASFDIKKFGDNIRTLLQDVQRGLEVRVSRIIGDLEGTLACDGMTRIQR